MSIIFISHRFSTVRRADRILYLQNGHIQEQGTHEELMRSNSRYATLFRMQARWYE
jgi:ABC-type multidrug transport system fused ATPase/permease subunit